MHVVAKIRKTAYFFSDTNYEEDMAFAERIQVALDTIDGAPQKTIGDPPQVNQAYRGIKEGTPSYVYRDGALWLNNNPDYPCSHACLAEIEHISNINVENSVVSGLNAVLLRDCLMQCFCKCYS